MEFLEYSKMKRSLESEVGVDESHEESYDESHDDSIL